MAVRIGFSPTSCSRIGSAHFGASGGTGRTARMWRVAASAIAPLQACGTANRPASPAAAAISRTPPIPPQIETSGWTRSNEPARRYGSASSGGFEDLAAGQGDRQLAREGRVGQVVVGRQRLLEPAEAEPLERRAEPHGCRPAVGAVAVGHPGHRPGPAATTRSMASISSSTGYFPIRSFIARKPSSHDVAASSRPGGFGREAAEVAPARGVGPDLPAPALAVQVRDGDATRASPQVVERHRDGAERPAMQARPGRQVGRGRVRVAARRSRPSSRAPPRRRPARGTSRPSRRGRRGPPAGPRPSRGSRSNRSRRSSCATGDG